MSAPSPPADLTSLPAPVVSDGQYRTTRVTISSGCFTDWKPGDIDGNYQVVGAGIVDGLRIKKVASPTELCIASLHEDGRFQSIVTRQDSECSWRETSVCTATATATNQFTIELNRVLSDVQSVPGKVCTRNVSMCNTYYDIDLVSP